MHTREGISGVRHLVDNDPPTKRASTHLKAAKKAGDSEPPDAADRPTVIPPFDLATYARESMPPSLVQQSPGATAKPPVESRESEEMPTVVPAKWDELGDEIPTVMPPPDALGSRDVFRSEMPTFTDENQLEQARRASLPTSTAPPGGAASVAPIPDPVVTLSNAPNHFSSRVSALSLADMRMPTPPPMHAVSIDDPEIEITEVSQSRIHSAVIVDSSAPPSQIDPIVDMKDRFSLGDYSGALAVAEMLLTKDASNVEAAKMAEECQRVLIKMYAARIGPLDRVPMVMVQPHELRWLSIDHRAGFLLSLVDGMSSIEMILDVSGMPLLDTLRILHELYQQRVISFRS